jgi:hypothetical protein
MANVFGGCLKRAFISVAPVQNTVHKKFSVPALITTYTGNHGLKAVAIDFI